MARIKIVTPPAAPVVTLAEAKQHLRVDHSDDDDLIVALVEAATGYVEKFQGRALIEQTLDIYLDAFPVYPEPWIEIPKPPLIEVEGLFYRASNGVDEVEFTDFLVDNAGDLARLYLASGGWPSAFAGPNAVRIRVRAGYLDGNSPPGEAVPLMTKAGLKLVLGTLYERRESVSSDPINELPLAEKLLRTNRVARGMA